MVKIYTICFLIFTVFIKGTAQNYDEGKVPAYTLPPILKTEAGEIIKNRSAWEKKRRQEILSLFEDHVYGQMPKEYDSIHFAVSNEVENALNGKANLKEVTITIYNKARSVDIHLILFTPNKLPKPAPAFLLINNRDTTNTDPSRILKSEFWPAEMIIENGYAVAAFHVDDAAPDNKENFQKGVLQLYPEQLHAKNGMRTIGSWAWAASRIMDYFESNKDIDTDKVAVVGHSRGGKAALWAGAQDTRFAIVFANNSGNTGAALSRRQFGETVKRINDNFPHWFTDNYKKYNENEAALPVDQHMLIALIAPRPIYVTSASEDLWADPKGSYLSLIHAQDVYRLYKRKSSLTSESPPLNAPIINSHLGYHIREGIHNLTLYDWENFILFADHHF